MQKIDFKKLITDFKNLTTKKKIIIAAIAAASIALLTTVIVLLATGGASSGNNQDGDNTGKATYKVTVVDQDDNPLSGASVEIYLGTTKHTTTTDSTGVATFANVKELPYTAKVSLDGYKADKKSYKFESNKTELKVQLTQQVTYTVTVLDAEGNPLEKADVQLCTGDNCKLPVATDANGVATLTVEKADYTIKINGVEVPDTFEDGTFELTIRLD